MDRNEKARAFGALHVKGDPLVLYNVWDAGSAKAVAEAGARAIASGNWAVAAAQGFGDGEALPFDLMLQSARQMAGAVDLPVSLDFEGGYAVDTQGLAENIGRLLDIGIVGINFEDRVVGGRGLHEPQEQAARIGALRKAADAKGCALFINARTDVFFQGSQDAPHVLLEAALMRAELYAAAGADGFFVPGLADADLIKTLCARAPLPVNTMRSADAPSHADLADLGVARISHGPGPYLAAMEGLRALAATTG